MLIVYVFASFLGALSTFAWLSSYGFIVALLCAPLGGSIVAAAVATIGVYVSSTKEASARSAAVQEHEFDEDTPERELAQAA